MDSLCMGIDKPRGARFIIIFNPGRSLRDISRPGYTQPG
jgi:hypothetical protein